LAHAEQWWSIYSRAASASWRIRRMPLPNFWADKRGDSSVLLPSNEVLAATS
jgi:hypothetical protein